jgi:hypothetical protein
MKMEHWRQAALYFIILFRTMRIATDVTKSRTTFSSQADQYQWPQMKQTSFGLQEFNEGKR